MGIATDLIFIVLAALVGGVIAHALKQPLVCGYILAGVLVGPYTGGIRVENISEIEKLAEIGVALLLFTLGLEFSFGELKRLAKVTLLLTPLQILLCSLAGYGVAVLSGIEHRDAMWIGAAISLSSTMVVLKTLASRDALDSSAGRVMLAMLIAQDLAVVPLMLFVPQLSASEIDYAALGWAAFKSAIFLALMYVSGTRILPRLFTTIANQGSRELFFLSTLGFAFGAGFISHEMGLSFALGAFVAGMLLSETDFNHQALSDVSNLRDLFAVIFFVSVGMLFDPSFFIDHLMEIIGLTAAFVIVKILVISGLVGAFRFGFTMSVAVSLGLSQVGEFAFVIVNAARRAGSISNDAYAYMIAVTVFSMVITPALFSLSAAVCRLCQPKDVEGEDSLSVIGSDLERHVVIIGGGVVGCYVSRVLKALARPHLVVESDYKIATQMRDQGMSVIFGDGTRRAILDAAGVAKCSLLVVTTTNDSILPDIIGEVKRISNDLPIVVRVEEVEDVETLSSLKVEEIVQPQLEVGLEMVRQALLALHVDQLQIATLLGQLRADRYEPGRFMRGSTTELKRMVDASRILELLWLEVVAGSPLAGATVQSSGLRERFGVSIVGIARRGDFIPTPTAEHLISEGDQLAILGTRSQFDLLTQVA
jgi:CPA2 family monovalent cation:H+ antiporter-2